MKHNKVKCRSRLRSSRLPVGKKVFFYFLPMKRVQGTCIKNSLAVLQFSFFASPQAKMIFGMTTSVNSDRKRKFQRFCPARSDCDNVAHGILSCYKLQDVFSQGQVALEPILFTSSFWRGKNWQKFRKCQILAVVALDQHV